MSETEKVSWRKLARDATKNVTVMASAGATTVAAVATKPKVKVVASASKSKAKPKRKASMSKNGNTAATTSTKVAAGTTTMPKTIKKVTVVFPLVDVHWHCTCYTLPPPHPKNSQIRFALAPRCMDEY